MLNSQETWCQFLLQKSIENGLCTGCAACMNLCPTFLRHSTEVKIPADGQSAINIEKFTPIRQFENRIDRLIETLKAMPRTKGVDTILMPDEKEYLNDKKRKKKEFLSTKLW